MGYRDRPNGRQHRQHKMTPKNTRLPRLSVFLLRSDILDPLSRPKLFEQFDEFSIVLYCVTR